MKLLIETAINGHVLRVHPGEEDETLIAIGIDDEVDAAVELLNEILYRIGEPGSKYGERQVSAAVRPGSKWEPPEGYRCEHAWVDRYELRRKVWWSCRCGQAFGPVDGVQPTGPDLEPPARGGVVSDA